MKIIPVIDIKQQQAVHAVKGQRDSYRPVNSPLCASADVNTLLAAYLNYYSFSHLYIADLDALSNNGNNYSLISALLQTYPTLRVWLDAGLHEYSQQLHTDFPGQIKIVLGTENNFEISLYQDLFSRFDCILSLDYRAGKLLGQYTLSELQPLFSNEVILMSLDSVGGANGPDLDKLTSLQQLNDTNIYMAGGIRNYQDLLLLQQRNVSGALLATSLHNMTLTPTEIAELESS